MTYRVEILCAKRNYPPALNLKPGGMNFACVSACVDPDRPSTRPIGERQIPDIAAAEARKNARDAGWIFIGGVWLCPACKPKADPVG